MTLPQKKLREAVFYAVFSFDYDESVDCESLVPLLMEQLEMSKKNVKNAIYKASLVMEKLSIIDAKLKEHVEGYSLERVSRAERNILRLATYEILFDNDLPEVVAIAEGIRLGRKFSTPEGANFINGVLDSLFKAQPISPSVDASC
jgi:N utilization substance protein B